MCHMSPVTCHVSPVTCKLSHVTCHMSCVTLFLHLSTQKFFFKCLNKLEINSQLPGKSKKVPGKYKKKVPRKNPPKKLESTAVSVLYPISVIHSYDPSPGQSRLMPA